MLHELAPTEAGPGVADLLPVGAPTRPRALAVIDGVLSGRVWADDAITPRSLLVLEDGDGTVYGGGELTRDRVAAALRGVSTASGDLIFRFLGAGRPTASACPGRALRARRGDRLHGPASEPRRGRIARSIRP